MQSEKILLADDDSQMLELLTEFLQKQGYQVAAAADGLQALEALKGREFHLALLNLKLPGFSGLKLLSHIKAHTPHTEVILFTGPGGVDSAIQALGLGAYDYFLKGDLRLDNLQAVVARALERHRLAQSNRELSLNLRQVQQELAQQRSVELAQFRRLSEALAVPLTWEQLFHGLLNLIWESLSLEALGIVFRGANQELSLEAFRRQPGLGDEAFQEFKAWLQAHFAKESGLAAASEKLPFPELLQETARAGEALAVVGAGRGLAFAPEEAEIFRIFVLQGEAALKNLVLFEEVKSLAIRDGLTGLYNYRHFWELLLHEVELSRRYGHPLSLLFLDLDNFKVINDTLGHPQGDAVLKSLASYLKGAVRQADVVCRYGGEEFVVLLPQTSPGQATVLAQRLRRSISRLDIPLPEQSLQLSVSIGVACLEAGMDASTLLNAADAALYRAKQAGKNQVFRAEPS